MAASTAISISLDEYLRTSYRPDREYFDGELVERNVGKYEHARSQFLLSLWFGSREKAWKVKGLTEQRVQVSATKVLIPDLALVARGPHPEILVDPPLLVVEILSPDDSYVDTQRRATDYVQMGVPVIRIIDPTTRTGRSCIWQTWTEQTILTVPGSAILINLHELFSELDEE